MAPLVAYVLSRVACSSAPLVVSLWCVLCVVMSVGLQLVGGQAGVAVCLCVARVPAVYVHAAMSVTCSPLYMWCPGAVCGI